MQGFAYLRRIVAACAFVVSLCVQAHGDAITQPAIDWLGTRQNPDGTWGASPDLVPRDTARVVHALALSGSSSVGVNSATGWLISQRFAANQFLAEQALALSAVKQDAGAVYARLAAQRSSSAGDFGGFTGHDGDVYDSAIALQAFAFNAEANATTISALVTTIAAKQNVDGGWGINGGFDSNIIVTGEVMIAFGMLRPGSIAPSIIAGGQSYLARFINPVTGAIGTNVLESAIALRALALNGGGATLQLGGTFNYLRGAGRQPNGSWDNDPYTTARALEALAANKPDIVVAAASLVLTPSTVQEGNSVSAKVVLNNVGFVGNVVATVGFTLGSETGRVLATTSGQVVNPGTPTTYNASFNATSLAGAQTIYAIADFSKQLDELREDNNTSTATLVVAGKPDLQVFAADIVLSPQRPQPNQQAQITVTVHNGGESDSPPSAVSLFDVAGASQTLLQKLSLGAISPAAAQVLTVPVTLSGGAHTIKAVVDPDAAVVEIDETNNSASRVFNVSVASSVDLRIHPTSLTVSNPRPATGEVITIAAKVENAGSDPVSSTLAFFDGVPGAAPRVIATSPISLDAYASRTISITYTTLADTRVIYAVADPDNLIAEIDEANNAAHVVLTDQFIDLAIDREGLVLPKTPPAEGQPMTARAVVRNLGSIAATQVEVALYDDLPQSGGVRVATALVDVPAFGKTVVSATWNVRGGQRIATAEINPTRVLFEPDFANNRMTKLYVAQGTTVDDIQMRTLNTSGLAVSATDLSVIGAVRVGLFAGGLPRPGSYIVTLFEDVDGDRAYNAETDNALASNVVDGRDESYDLVMNVQSRVRFAPARLMLYLDSSNAVSERHEENNLIDFAGACEVSPPATTDTVFVRQSFSGTVRMMPAIARFADTNGDGVVDENDVVSIAYTIGGTIIARRGDNGQVLWSRDLDTRGRQSDPLIADLDGDGQAEVVAHTNDHRLVALNGAGGTTKWTSPELDRDPAWNLYASNYSYAGAPAAADLDGDGKPEVITGRSVLNGLDGSIKWIGTGGRGRAFDTSTDQQYNDSFPDQEASIAVDVNNDGKLEVIAGNTIYRHDGTILAQRTDLPDGYTAPVHLNGSVTPKVCLVARGNVYLLNSDLTTFWGPIAIPGGARLGGAPTVWTSGSSFVIGVAGDTKYTAFNASDGSVRWSHTSNTDLSFGFEATNAAAVFNADSQKRWVVYAGRTQFLVLDASTGADKYVENTGQFSTSAFYPGSPAVADVDGDGHADFAVGGNNGLRVFGNSTWWAAPGIYNELAYHITNVTNDRAAIPAREQVNTSSYRANQTSFPASSPLPNLTASFLRVDTGGYPNFLALTVRIGNVGWATASTSTTGFYRRNADGSSTKIGSTATGAITAGGYEDVLFVESNPQGGSFTYFAKANDAAPAISECRTDDNTSPLASAKLTADIAAVATSFFISDPLPKAGDVVTLTATATVAGVVPPGLTAQFFDGNPAAGGIAITGPLPVSASHGGVVSVEGTWTVNAAAGDHILYVVFDPANAVVEDNESNNTAALAITVSTPDPIQKISATTTLNPASAEAGTPVSVQILLKNIGNVPLTNVTLAFTATGGSIEGPSTGQITIASLPKNNVASVAAGTFKPTANATYTVNVTTDAAITLVASPATIKVGPYAFGTFTLVPMHVPTNLPLVQARARVTRGNAIVVPDDPLAPVITASVQKALDFTAPGLKADLAATSCVKCHVYAQGIVALDAPHSMPGIRVDDTVTSSILARIKSVLAPDGTIPQTGYNSAAPARLSGFGLAFHHDAAAAKPLLTSILQVTLRDQRTDGSWTCDGGCFSEMSGSNQAAWDNPETWTFMSIVQLGRGYDMVQDPRYRDAIARGAAWCIAYPYTTTSTTSFPAPAIRVAMGIQAALPYLTDPVQIQAAKNRVQSITTWLRGIQGGDGAWGSAYSSGRTPVIITAQAVYLLTRSGAAPSDPQVRAAIVWLLNRQHASGAWFDRSQNLDRGMEPTAWSVAALSAVSAAMPSFNATLRVTLPDNTDLVSASPPATGIATVSGGRELSWTLNSVSESGSDTYLNLRLNGLQNGESRPIASAAAVAYVDPNNGEPRTRPIDIPLATGRSPVGLSLSADKSSYAANSDVALREVITDATAGLTNEVVIRNGTGATVATIAAGEPLAGLPAPPFAGWHYGVAATMNVPAGVSRNGSLSIDFAQLLTQLGTAGTFDPNTIRVTMDSAPSSELPYTWFAASMNAGALVVQVPDDVPSATAVPIHVYFDTLENGIKPRSLFDRSATLIGAGLRGSYTHYVPSSVPFGNAGSPSVFVYTGPPFATTANKTGAMTVPYEALATPYWTAVLSGAFYAPVTGTYQLLFGSQEGGWLDIDGVRVINNPNQHGLREVSASISLAAGFHRVSMMMYRWEWSGFQMYLKWAPPGAGFELIPSQNLFFDVPFTGNAIGAPATVITGQVTRTFTWNTASTAAGAYTAAATLRRDGTFVVSASAPFTIAPSTQITASVGTDKAQYDIGQTVRVTGAVQYAAGNSSLTNLTAVVAVVDAANAVVASRTVPIASLAPGQSVPVQFDWSIGNASAGTYTSTLTIKDSAGTTLAQKSAPFQIRATSQSGKGITGTLTTATTVSQQQPIAFAIAITNGGNDAIADAPFAVQIVDATTQQAADTISLRATVAAGATYQTNTSYLTTPLSPKTYQAWLVSLVGGTTLPLASATFEVTPPVPTVVTATAAPDKSSYDVGDTVHVTTTVNYLSGAAPLSGITVTTSINGATGSTTIGAITPGATAQATFDWPVGTTAPGPQTITVVVKDASGNVLAQNTATFTIRSTAVSGKGITGTLTTSATVTQGDPLTLNATIVNNGNAAITDAPFAVKIGSDTIAFTMTAATGASVAKQLTYATATLTPQIYTATLVSLITGQAVTLATATFEVKPLPAVVVVSAAPDKSSYDVGDTVHVTTTVNYLSGPAPLSGITVTTSINGATGTTTIGAIVPGATAQTTFDWPVGTSAPGPQTITVVVKDASGNVLAQNTATFTIRSTAVSGKGITGTLTTSATVTQGDPLPLNATIANNGNAAITDAPFAVKIGSDTIAFTITAATGASVTKQLTYATATLTPQTYTATLVSLITGQPVTLATTTFEVKPLPTALVVSAAPDKSSYDLGDTVHVTTTVNYLSGAAPLSGITVTTSINGATGSTTIGAIMPGATAQTTFDWPVGTTAPGPQTITVVVKDASGNVLAQNTATFTIRSTAVSGKGITGTLTTSATITQGDPLTLNATIANNGNAAITDAPFAVKIGSDTIAFTITVANGASIAKQLTYATATLTPQTYTATLVSLITGQAVTLATATFEVKPAQQTTLSVAVSTSPRVLLWADCAEGNSGKPCTPVVPPFLTRTLTTAGIPWTLTGDEKAFLALLRTGAFSVSVLDPPPVSEPKIAAELAETIYAGSGLLMIKDRLDAMPKLVAALGTSFNGKVNATSTLVDVLATPFTAASQITMNGDGTRLTLQTAKALANVSATQLPAMAYNAFGAGKSVIIPFDVEKTATADVAKLMVSATRYVSRTAAKDARQVVPVAFTVGAPTGGSQPVTVALALPAGATIAYAFPQLTTSTSWSATVAGGGTTVLTAWIRLPEAIGTYDVTATIAPALTKTITLTVDADRAAIEKSLAADLDALKAGAPAKDLADVNRALDELATVRAATTNVEDAITHIMKLIDNLAAISTDTSAARRDADRLLLYWQSRA